MLFYTENSKKMLIIENKKLILIYRHRGLVLGYPILFESEIFPMFFAVNSSILSFRPCICICELANACRLPRRQSIRRFGT